ncbi:MAG: S9 family peptidase [Nitriliruptoraceae bacterium]
MATPRPPAAPKRPRTMTRADGTTFDDPWYWLRDRDDPAVREHLDAENAYADAVLASQRPRETAIFAEIRDRIAEDDASAPVFVPSRIAGQPGWVYYRRIRAGQQYPVHARRRVEPAIRDVRALPDELRRAVDPLAPPADEIVLLDENLAAEGHDYFRVAAFAVSPGQQLAAEAVDTTGEEIYTIRFRDLTTGQLLDDELVHTSGSLAWFDDDATILYTVPDDAWRPWKVFRHRLATPQGDDELLHTEADERFWVGLGRSRSDAFLLVRAASKVTSGWYAVDADAPDGDLREVVARRDGVDVDLDHHGDDFLLVTNADGAVDFKLCAVAADDPRGDAWRELVPHRPGVRLEAVDAFADHLVLAERTEARTRLRLCAPDGSGLTDIEVPSEVSTAVLAANPVFDTRVVRFAYTSLVTPTEVIDLDLETGERFVVTRQQVRGGHDPDDYVTWRDWATSEDGTRVPISLVARRDVLDAGPAPCLLYGYGAYEISIDPTFSIPLLSLLDRGMVFAIAHVRGGGEMGRAWYEQGRLASKRATFDDFIAVGRHLVATGRTSSDRLAIRGGSAGGMLIGAVINRAPELAAVAVAEVPFVDVVTTMSDASIPLTVIEYDEWGDPTDPEVCAVMRAYSPVDNVAEARRPALLVTAGLHDPRVQYWEPVKWVAGLRETATGGGPVVCKVEMRAGHGGRSGRYDAWREEAEVLAFIVERLGVAEAVR